MLFGLESFNLGIFFFGAPSVGFGRVFVALEGAPSCFEPSTVSVTSSILGVFLSQEALPNLVALILGRGVGLGVEVGGRA